MNKEFSDLNELLKFAITKEEGAYKLYSDAINIVKNKATKVMLKEFADIELGHIEILNNAIKKGNAGELGSGKPIDLEIGDFLVSEEITEKSTSQDVMIYAIKREKGAYEFYSQCELVFKGSNLESMFNKLKIEELKHKERLEKEYDDVVYKEM